MLEGIMGTIAVLFLLSLVVFVGFLTWWTGILLPIATVRWCMQLNAMYVMNRAPACRLDCVLRNPCVGRCKLESSNASPVLRRPSMPVRTLVGPGLRRSMPHRDSGPTACLPGIDAKCVVCGNGDCLKYGDGG